MKLGNLYNLEYWDNEVPKELHEEIYNYCQNQYWYSKIHNPKSASIDPKKQEWKLDLQPEIPRRTLYRIPFAWDTVTLQKFHPLVWDFFSYINKTFFDDRFIPEGKLEGVAGRSPREYAKNPFTTSTVSGKASVHQATTFKNGWTSYMNAQPYDSVKRTKNIHRDWDDYGLIESNEEEYSTILFVSNLEWYPSWFSEITYYDHGETGERHGDLLGPDESTVFKKREFNIGWPVHIIPNVPGRLILMDGRWLHSTKPTSYLAPELSQHIAFRVKRK